MNNANPERNLFLDSQSRRADISVAFCELPLWVLSRRDTANAEKLRIRFGGRIIRMKTAVLAKLDTNTSYNRVKFWV